ncbi:MFS transporter [Halapricum sp. CBA1109]|uniref:MFS transporter n=1 Tax=Halapricum sp. CBA1109 TaxID=2668068 RepID=UPI0012F83814|nr:MFS transporter [Halapricum sp. CBA1109]MUV88960.1 MFS transporter [Halapricum sp. CBA1109]
MHDSGRTRATLGVILAAATLTVMAGAILGPVVPSISAGLGVSGALAGLIITTHGILIVLVSPVAGSIIDRIGPRRPFVLGLGLYGVGGGAGLVVDSFLPLLASRVVLGVGVAFVYTGITVLLFTLYEGRRMDRALGLRSSANSLGAAVWPLVGGALGSLSWQAPFAVYLVAIPLGLAAVLAIPTTDRSRPAGSDASLSARLRGLAAVFVERPTIPAVYLLYFTANLLLYAVVVYYPQLLGEVGVTATLTVGLYLAVNGAAGGVVAAVYDRLVARAGRTWLVTAAGALWAVGFALAAVVATPLAAAAPVVLIGFGIGLVFPSAFAWIEALAPPDRQGSLSSYVASAGYLGQFCSPLAFGLAVPLGGVRAVFAAAAAVAVLTLGGTLLAGRRGANSSI